MKIRLAPLLFATLCFTSAANANFHYCTGKILDIVTRDSAEESSLRIDGLNGWASLTFSAESTSEMRDRQFSMILSAFYSDYPVTLEFVSTDTVNSCDDTHDTNTPVRYVRLRK